MRESQIKITMKRAESVPICRLTPRSHWKRSIISALAKPTVQTTPSRKRSFLKTLLKPDINHFENRAFWKLWPRDNHAISLLEYFLQTQILSADEKNWRAFRVKTLLKFGVMWTEYWAYICVIISLSPH